MGGSLKVVVREKNGKVTKMCRWTNNLGYWFQTPEFIENPDKVLREYIEAGDKSAYNYEDATLAPDGYGLLVFDAVNKLILSHQDYTYIGMYHGAGMMLDVHIHECFDKKAKDSPIPYINLNKLAKYQEGQKEAFGRLPIFKDKTIDEELKDMKKHYDLFMSGAIQIDEALLKRMKKNNLISYFRCRQYASIGKILKKKNKTDKDWLEFILYNRKLWNINFFKIDLAGYEVIDFDNNEENIVEYALFFDKLNELGFKLTKEDKADWEEFLQDYEE